MTAYDLPYLNAVLNGIAATLLLLGFAAIRAGRVRLHRSLMLTALAVSATFLASYLYYHLAVRRGAATRYTGEWRPVYLAVLVSHTILAVLAAPLALVQAWLGLTWRLTWHRRLAWVTFPVWLYVSVTGVAIYQFLRGLYPTGN